MAELPIRKRTVPEALRHAAGELIAHPGTFDARKAAILLDQLAQRAEEPTPLEVVDLARVAVKPGDTLLVRPREDSGVTGAQEFYDWAEFVRKGLTPHFPGVIILILPPSDVAVIEGGDDDARLDDRTVCTYGLRNHERPYFQAHPYAIDLATARRDLALPSQHTLERGTELVRSLNGEAPWEVVLIADGEGGWTEPEHADA